jgi:hypothetical protein
VHPYVWCSETVDIGNKTTSAITFFPVTVKTVLLPDFKRILKIEL